MSKFQSVVKFYGNYNLHIFYCSRNRVVDCSQLPQVDLSLWRDASSVPSYADNFLTSFPNYFARF